MYIYSYTYIYIFIYLYVFTYAYMHSYLHTYICIYTLIYIYVYRYKKGQRSSRLHIQGFIGCPISIGLFPQNSPILIGFYAQRDT